MAQVGSPAGRGQPAAIAGARSAIEADAEATKIEFRTEDGRTTTNVLTDQRGIIVATVSNKGGIQLTGLKTNIQVDGTIVRQDDLTIAPGQSQDLRWIYAFTAPGNHIIALTVDPRNEITETNKNNNRTEKVITVTARVYDVSASHLDVNILGGQRQVIAVNQGQDVELVGTATNLGNAPMTRVKIALMVDGSNVREQTVAIEPGRTASVTRQYRFDAPGRHSIAFAVDTDNAFQETNKNNNRIERAYEVRPVALRTDIRLEPQMIKVSPYGLPYYGALYQELANAMELVKTLNRDLYQPNTDTYKNAVIHCLASLPKNYTAQDQQAAGCTATDAVDLCKLKLYNWCCTNEAYRRFLYANQQMEMSMNSLVPKLEAYRKAIKDIYFLFTPFKP